MNKIATATIWDIYTPVEKLSYFDPHDIEWSIKFYKDLSINFLPSKIDSRKYYKLIKGEMKFDENPKEIDKKTSIRIDSLLFSNYSLQKFSNNDWWSDNILFVTDVPLTWDIKSKIIWVVHIVDYEEEFIYVELYKLFHRFELKIKEILKNKFLTIDLEQAHYDFHKLVWYSNPDKPCKPGKVSPFDNCDFKILIEYFKNFKNLDNINTSNYKIDDIIPLRNHIMHSKEILNINWDQNNNLIYNFNSLNIFVKRVKVFLQFYEEIINS